MPICWKRFSGGVAVPVRRKKGKFTRKQIKVGRSLAIDRRSKSKTIAKKGEGDTGDQRKRKAKRKVTRKKRRV
jgi:hypothetical protein